MDETLDMSLVDLLCDEEEIEQQAQSDYIIDEKQYCFRKHNLYFVKKYKWN